jgi:hypothetical protein
MNMHQTVWMRSRVTRLCLSMPPIRRESHHRITFCDCDWDTAIPTDAPRKFIVPHVAVADDFVLKKTTVIG